MREREKQNCNKQGGTGQQRKKLDQYRVWAHKNCAPKAQE